MKQFIFISLFMFSLNVFPGKEMVLLVTENGTEVKGGPIELKPNEIANRDPSPILKLLRKKQKNNRKITAALLAFPFPFGIVGLHRIYLGTKPYVPIAYIGTLGGVFGIIPLVDFFAIILDKDFEHFENNGKVLMWVK